MAGREQPSLLTKNTDPQGRRISIARFSRVVELLPPEDQPVAVTCTGKKDQTESAIDLATVQGHCDGRV